MSEALYRVQVSRGRLWCFVGPALAVDAAANVLRKRDDVAVRIVRGERCISKQLLLHEWAAALEFPSYFGNNWDALDECLNDLDWLQRPRCVVYMTNADASLRRSPRAFQTFISVARDATEFSADAAHSHVALSIVLHCSEPAERQFRARLSAAGFGPTNLKWTHAVPQALV